MTTTATHAATGAGHPRCEDVGSITAGIPRRTAPPAPPTVAIPWTREAGTRKLGTAAGPSAPHEATTQPLPVAGAAGPSGRRVGGVDAARGLALIGMIAVHTLPLTDDDGTVTMVGHVAAGTSAALFGVLVGVSIAFLTGRQRVVLDTASAARHALRLVVRGLAVGAVGLVLGEAAIGNVDVILTYYGVLFVLAVPLVFLSTRALFALGAVLVVVAPSTSHLLRVHLPPTELIDPSFTALVSDPGGLLTVLLFTGAYPAWPWLAYLCVGIAVGRCPLARTRTAVRLVTSGLVLAVSAAGISYLALAGLGGLDHILAGPGLPQDQLRAALTEGPDGVTPTSTWWWLAVDRPHSSTPLDVARTLGTSLAALGTMLLLDRGFDRLRSYPLARVGSAAITPLAAAGSMTLTLYTLHVVFVGVAPQTDPWVLYIVQIVFALLVGSLWRHAVGRGPLEAAVSTLIDRVAPPPARGHAPQGRAAIRMQTPIVVAVLVLAVAGGAGVALASTSSAASAPSASARQDADTGGPGDSPGAADTPEADDPSEAPDQADTPEPEDRPDSADQQGQDPDG